MTSSRETPPGRVRTARSAASRLRNSPLLVRAMSSVPVGGCVVLRYHSVSSDPGWAGDYMQESLVVAPDVFERQVAFLVSRYRVVSVGAIAEALADGRPVGRRCVAITFDDGYEDNHRVALPILLRHGATAAFYVTTGAMADRDLLWPVKVRRAVRRTGRTALGLSFVGERPLDVATAPAREAAVRLLTGLVKSLPIREARAAVDEIVEACGVSAVVGERRVLMSEDEIRGMRDAGMTVGAHTVNHFNLPSLTSTDVESEVAASKATLEAVLGTEVVDFAYPNGRTARHCDARVARIVADQGFRSAVTSIAGAVSRRVSPYGIPRLGIYRRHASVRRLAADVEYTRFQRPTGGVLQEISHSVGERTRGRGGAAAA